MTYTNPVSGTGDAQTVSMSAHEAAVNAAIAEGDAALLALASAGDPVRLSYVSGDGQAATYEVVAAQAALTLGVGQLLQFAWQAGNTAVDPTLTIGGVTYTLRGTSGAALAADDLRNRSYLGRIHTISPAVIRLLTLTRIADVPGLGDALAAETAAREAGVADAIQDAAEAQNTADDAADAAAAAQADVDAEVAARGAVIEVTPSGDLVVRDPAGFVMLRANATLLSLMGATTLADLMGDELIIRDPAGFVVLRAGPDSLRHMGREIGGLSGVLSALPDARASLDSVLRADTRSLSHWRWSRAGAIQGTRRARALFLGDSNTAGHSALGPGVHRRALASPDTLARMLPPAYGATRDNVMGSMVTGYDYPTYDPRLAPGSGWAPGGATSLGGSVWRNTSTTGTLGFTPVEAWDTADVWVALESAATFDVGISGDVDTVSPATGSIVKITYTAPTVAVQELQITRATGDVRIIGWDCYRAGAGGMSIINAGRSGSRSDQIADDTDWFGPLQSIAAVDPDLVVIQIGLNDIAQGILPSVYKANVQWLVEACITAGADVVLTVPAAPSEPRNYPWADYTTALYDLADAYSLPVVDITNRLGAYPVASAAGWTSDTLHPNATGYAETAQIHANLLTF